MEHLFARRSQPDPTRDPRAARALDLIARRLPLADPLVERFRARLEERHPRGIAAVIFYGSCLFQETRTATSVHDFYVLTDEPLRFYPKLWQAALNLGLPPNVYYTAFQDRGEELRCKYCVMSLAQFEHETSSAAHDVHHLGRFSKQFALVHARDEATRGAVERGALRAMLSLVAHSLALLPAEFSLDEFLLQQLSLSYLGEQRVAEPDKVLKLFRAAREFYVEIYPEVLALHAALHGAPTLVAPGRYAQPHPTPRERRATEAFLRRSRYRGVMRWPKYMATVDNWLDYALDKLERHQGLRLQLSARERRHPLLFGWPRFLELRRKGMVG